jgi:hypothetical protein
LSLSSLLLLSSLLSSDNPVGGKTIFSSSLEEVILPAPGSVTESFPPLSITVPLSPLSTTIVPLSPLSMIIGGKGSSPSPPPVTLPGVTGTSGSTGAVMFPLLSVTFPPVLSVTFPV